MREEGRYRRDEEEEREEERHKREQRRTANPRSRPKRNEKSPVCKTMQFGSNSKHKLKDQGKLNKRLSSTEDTQKRSARGTPTVKCNHHSNVNLAPKIIKSEEPKLISRAKNSI